MTDPASVYGNSSLCLVLGWERDEGCGHSDSRPLETQYRLLVMLRWPVGKHYSQRREMTLEI